MLKDCVLDYKGNWDDHLPLIDFTYKNSYHLSVQMDPYEALYGRRCRSLVSGLIGKYLVHQEMDKVKVNQERSKTAQSLQKSCKHVTRMSLEFEVDWVSLKDSPINGVIRFGKKKELSPRYIGPYQVFKRVGNVS